jgi:translation initiation factor IF-2
VAFTVSTPRSVEVLAKQQSVPLVSSKIIYSLIDDIRSRVIQLLPLILETKVTGEANVLQLFDIQLKSKKTMKVAGCRVANGIVDKSKHVRVVRDRETIFEGIYFFPRYSPVCVCFILTNYGCFFEGHLDTFKHLKKDITEAGKGLECGLSIGGFDGLKVGDLIQVFEKIEKPGIL